MAIIYFPKSANLGLRDSFNPTYESLILATNPNTVLYMDYTSGINAATASNLYITASWALTASISNILISSSLADNAISSSYASTASFAMNGGGGGGGAVGAASWSFYHLPVQSAKLANTKSALLNNGTYCWELLFRPEESAVWQMRVPAGYSSSLSTTFQWYPTASNAGAKQVLWNVYLTRLPSGATTASVPLAVIGITSSFQQSGSTLQQTTVWLTGSPVTSSDFLIYKLERGTGSADTAVGSMAVVSAMLEWIKS